MTTLDRRQLLTTGGAAIATLAAPASVSAEPRIILNDASRLNPTPVMRHWIVKPDDEANLIAALRAELKRAAGAKQPIAVGAARHSMGGQSLPRDGTAITLAINRCEPNTSARTYEAHAGTRWNEVLAKLDTIGFSPAVMQANADFGIASTFSVNSHGWPVPYGPFGSTVRRIEMMLADGSLVTCSRTENTELFKLAMGGYGHFGIILKVEADMVENVILKPTFATMPSTSFAERFMAATRDPAVLMMYGRLSVARATFFKDALLVTLGKVAGQPAAMRTGAGGFTASLSRQVYRAQIGSDVAKRARWVAETVAGPRAGATPLSRNTILNDPVSVLANRDRSRTDILHEYFIPPDRFGAFLALCQEVMPGSGQDVLNITVRYVVGDDTSVLAYAPGPRMAAVISFSQLVTPEAEASMLKLTETLIDRVAAIGGGFYLHIACMPAVIRSAPFIREPRSSLRASYTMIRVWYSAAPCGPPISRISPEQPDRNRTQKDAFHAAATMARRQMAGDRPRRPDRGLAYSDTMDRDALHRPPRRRSRARALGIGQGRPARRDQHVSDVSGMVDRPRV